jgi:hypothetical protein
MKQIIVLESEEIKRLEKGKTLLITTLGGELGIQFSSNGHEPEKVLACPICHISTKSNGEPFTTERGVLIHTLKVHGARKKVK